MPLLSSRRPRAFTRRRVLATSLAVALAAAVLGGAVAPAGDAVAAVPAASNTTSVVTIKTGGDRTGGATVAPLAGVVLHLREGGNNGPTAERADDVAGDGAGWARCVSDAQGDCSFTVPRTHTSFNGGNRNARFWVVQQSAPTGWVASAALRTGSGDGSGSQATPYVFRTPALVSNTVYRSTDTTFMVPARDGNGRDANNDRDASGGVWQQRRVNPSLPLTCGLDVALVLDLSNSVSNNGALEPLKDQADALANALVGTPSRMALFSFGSLSPALTSQPNDPTLRSVATQSAADAFTSTYADWVTPTLAGDQIRGGTNWDRGLYAPAQATGALNDYDVAVVLTDGNPTLYGPDAISGGSTVNGSGNYTRFREVENGIFSANALKAQGTRVLAVGVGPGITDAQTGLNLAAISGSEAYNAAQDNALTADYYQLADVNQAGRVLADLVQAQCASSLSVTKMIVPEGGDTSDAEPAGAGWDITATSTTTGAVPAPATRTTTDDGTGSVSYPLNVTSGTATLEVREAQQPGYAYLGSECIVRTASGSTTRVTTEREDDPAAPGFSVSAAQGERISCTIYNTPAPASLTLVKTVEGGDADPASWTLTATGPAGAEPGPTGPTGTSAEVTPGATYVLSESGGDPRYVQVDERTRPLQYPASTGSWSCTDVITGENLGGAEGAISVPSGASVECEAVNQTASLTLLKHVADPLPGGDTADDWTLSADPATGVTGLDRAEVAGAEEASDENTVLVRPGHDYTIDEEGPTGYRATLQRLVGEEWVDVDDQTVSVAALDTDTYRLVNARIPGSIAWSKVADGAAQAPLAGSTWQIVGPDHPADDPLIVEDADETGSFLVEGLDWGTYTVTEIAAAPGYALADPAPSFTATLTGDDRDYVHADAIANPQREITLPVAGGSGTWPYLAGGALVLLIAAVAALRAWRRRA